MVYLHRENQTRSREAAKRNAATARRIILAARDDAVLREGLTDEQSAAIIARAKYPTDSLGQLAERCGWTRDRYAAQLRRGMNLATDYLERTKA